MDQNNLVNAIFLCFVNAFFMIAGIFLNSVVIISLIRSSQLRKNHGYFMILVPSCFDLAVVIFNHPVSILFIVSWSMGNHHQNKLEDLAYIIGYNLSGFSTSTLLTMSVERYLALKYLFFHHTAETKTRLLLFLAFFIITIVSVSPLLYLYTKTFGNAFIIVFASLFLFLFIYLNYNILIIAKSKREVENSATTDHGQKTRNRRKINCKNISTCSIAIGCFFVCALPLIINSVLRSTGTFSTERDIKLNRFRAVTLANINSTLNCLIFFWRNSILRREGIKTVNVYGLEDRYWMSVL